MMSGGHQFRLDSWRECIRSEISDPCQLAKFDPRRAVAGADNAIADNIEFSRFRLQDGRSDIQYVLAQGLGRLQGGFPANAGTARRPGATTVGRVVRVPQYH